MTTLPTEQTTLATTPQASPQATTSVTTQDTPPHLAIAQPTVSPAAPPLKRKKKRQNDTPWLEIATCRKCQRKVKVYTDPRINTAPHTTLKIEAFIIEKARSVTESVDAQYTL